MERTGLQSGGRARRRQRRLRRRKNSTHEAAGLGRLPWHLQTAILARLPPRKVLELRAVCRSWNMALRSRAVVEHVQEGWLIMAKEIASCDLALAAKDLQASLDDMQDAAPSCVKGAIVRRRGRKDVYLCYKDPHNWFPHHNNVLSPHLPFLLKKAISMRQKDMPTKIRLMVCEGTQLDSNAEVGDVMIFPEMVQYKGLTVSKIDSFVEDVLVHEKDWILGNREKIRGTYVFVQPLSSISSASSGANMTFNGLDGATLLEIFKREAASRGLEYDHIINSSLQIHGHKHHGNVVVYSPDIDGLYTESCWSSLVCYASDVAVLVDMFSGNAKTIEDVLKRQVEKPQDASKDKQWLQHGFSSLKTSYALATLASLSVVVVIGSVVAFKLSKKAE